jgi:hypothetical protein
VPSSLRKCSGLNSVELGWNTGSCSIDLSMSPVSVKKTTENKHGVPCVGHYNGAGRNGFAIVDAFNVGIVGNSCVSCEFKTEKNRKGR